MPTVPNMNYYLVDEDINAAMFKIMLKINIKYRTEPNGVSWPFSLLIVFTNLSLCIP
jgi:hypothetical protein